MTSGASRGQVFTPNRRPMKKRMAPGTSREPPGDPEGPPKSSKNRFVAEKWCCHGYLNICFQPSIFFIAVLSILTLFLEGPNLKKPFSPNEKYDIQERTLTVLEKSLLMMNMILWNVL